MASLEEKFEKACKDRTIPGAVLIASNKSGSLRYEKAFGALSLEDGQAEKPLKVDTVFMIASCTKLMTSIAAMQCVERGLIGLDNDLTKIVPELAALEILSHFDEGGKAITVKRKTPITLRHLLSHSAGLGYDGMSPKLQRYRESRNERLGGGGKTLYARFGIPLLYEPGTSWGYSSAIDWAGRVVERLTGNTLEEYMLANMWKPLGIKDMTFWLESRPDMKARMSGMTIRDPEGSDKVVFYSGPSINHKATECLGGQGCYATMPEYMKILQSLLVDDEKLLKKDTAAQMFSPQLSTPGRRFLNELRDRPEVWSMFPGEYPRHIGLDWGLGGMLTVEDDAGWRGGHTMIWSGLPNLYWFIDRKVGLCGIYGGQVLPPGDQLTGQMITAFEKAMYKMVATGRSKM